MDLLDFLQSLPKHECELCLTHNQHKSYYETVASSIDNNHGYAQKYWISPEQRDLAIATNECWTLQWYPRSPVGFNLVSACTLEALLEYVAREHP